MNDPASKLTEERGKVYGDPLGDFACVQTMYDAWLGRRGESPNWPVDGSGKRSRALQHGVYMILVKLARLAFTPYHADSLADIAGYVKCLQECAPLTLEKVIQNTNADLRNMFWEKSEWAKKREEREWKGSAEVSAEEFAKAKAEIEAEPVYDSDDPSTWSEEHQRIFREANRRLANRRFDKVKPSEYRTTPAYVERGDGELPSPPVPEEPFEPEQRVEWKHADMTLFGKVVGTRRHSHSAIWIVRMMSDSGIEVDDYVNKFKAV